MTILLTSAHNKMWPGIDRTSLRVYAKPKCLYMSSDKLFYTGEIPNHKHKRKYLHHYYSWDIAYEEQTFICPQENPFQGAKSNIICDGLVSVADKSLFLYSVLTATFWPKIWIVPNRSVDRSRIAPHIKVSYLYGFLTIAVVMSRVVA